MEPVPWTGGELLALRGWRLARWSEDDSIRLWSLGASTVWHGPVFTADQCPLPYSHHGVYAIKPSRRSRMMAPYGPDWLTGKDAWIWGWVSLVGRVVEHADGYRAQAAVVRRLHLGVKAHLAMRSPEELDCLIVELEQRYQCSVRAGSWESRKACRVRGNPRPPTDPAWRIPICTPAMATPPAQVAYSPPAPLARVAPAAPLHTPPKPKKRRPGFSPTGLRYADVVRAFVRAEKQLGTEWILKGPDRCRRVTLKNEYSRVLGHATRSWDSMYPRGACKPLRIFPLPIVSCAAKILGVGSRSLIGRELMTRTTRSHLTASYR